MKYHCILSNLVILFNGKVLKFSESVREHFQFSWKTFIPEIEFTTYNLIYYIFRYCDNRRKALLAHVHEGYERDVWLYTDPDC